MPRPIAVAARTLAGLSLLSGLLACEPLTPPDEREDSLAQQSAALSCGRLNANEVLLRGQSLWSCNGALELRHQGDGNLVAYDRQGVIWATYTSGQNTRLVMQADGNLVLYNNSTALWHTRTNGRSGVFLALQNDCNLVLYQGSTPVWASYAFCRAVPVPPSSRFVSASGGQFYLNGKRFKHVGINTPQLVYQPRDQVITTLDRAKSAGIRHIRVFLPNNAMQGSAWDPWEIRARLKLVLDEALSRDIRVTVALAHNYFQGVWGWEGRNGKHAVWGDEGFYTRQDIPGLPMLDDRWLDWGYARGGGSYKDFAWAIASAFKDHAGVFAWDIANEVNMSNPGNAALLDIEVNFYKNMAKMLKQADPNHMVTTGLISTHWAGLDDARKRAIYDDPNINYLVVHEYDDDNEHHEYDDIRRAKAWFSPRKPVIVEEAGLASARGNFSLMQKYYQKLYDDLGVDAVLQWGVQFSCAASGGQDWGSGDGAYGPCEQGRLSDYTALWKSWSTELERRNNL